jgi:uncharacterized SAM-binding protein YcdF (DUF218 family)
MLSYSLVKLLSLFVYPLTQVMLLLFLGLYFFLRGSFRPSLLSFCTASIWLWLCSMPYVAGALMSHLEKDYPPVAARHLPRADAIVLLGGAIRGVASPETLADMSGIGDRLVFAVAAFKAGKAPFVLVTGGGKEGDVPESALIRDILVTMGIPLEKIVVETRNRVTRDNGRFTSEQLAGMGVESILLVTSAFHMPRAMLVFEPLDLTIYPAPSDYQVLMSDGGPSLGDFLPSVKALQRTTWVFHERVGYWYYKLVA